MYEGLLMARRKHILILIVLVDSAAVVHSVTNDNVGSSWLGVFFGRSSIAIDLLIE
ncbi:hypothetical protein A2U01_0057865, partial [Trifolium medium]|nr:hypothetical protein [Trifolium medium]